MKIINMTNHKLSQRALGAIKKKYGEYELVNVPIHLDIPGDVIGDIEKIMSELMPYLIEPRVAFIAPAVNYVAVIFTIYFHGVTGHYPQLITLIRDDDVHVVKSIYDLAHFRNEGRKMRISYLRSAISSDDKTIGLYDED